MCVSLISCASSKETIGSQAWYEKRMAEIEESYKKNEIDQAKYLELKNEVDAIRADHAKSGRGAYTHAGFGFGSDGGSSVGIGVGF